MNVYGFVPVKFATGDIDVGFTGFKFIRQHVNDFPVSLATNRRCLDFYSQAIIEQAGYFIFSCTGLQMQAQD